MFNGEIMDYIFLWYSSVVSYGPGFGPNRTKPLSHGLIVYGIQNKFNGLVWIGLLINGLILVQFGSKTQLYR